MNKLILGFLSTLILCGTTCRKDDGHYCINVENRSNSKIYVLNSDTFKCFAINYNSSNFIVEANSENKEGLCLLRSTWEGVLSRPNGYFPIYFYNRDSVVNLQCDSIAKNQPYYKKVVLSLDYLNQNNWTISYP